MEYDDGLGTEISLILKSEFFARATTQSRVLMYLYRHSRERGGCATQYDIATEGLGKPDFDEVTDSSVRVQISRLRKALADYYLYNAPHDGLCVYIKRGEYRLRSARIAISYPELSALASAASLTGEPDMANSPGSSDGHDRGASSFSAEEQAAAEPQGAASNAPGPAGGGASRTFPTPSVRLFLAVGAAIVALFASTVAFGLFPRAAPQVSAADYPLTVPTIGFRIEEANLPLDAGNGERVVKALSVDLDALLQKSMVSRVPPVGSAEDQDYFIDVHVTGSGEDRVRTFVSLRNRGGDMLSEVTLSSPGDLPHLRESVYDEILKLITNTGPISKDLNKRIGAEPRNAFECFVTIENRTSDERLNALVETCVAQFPEEDHWPYLASRKVLGDIQRELQRGGTISRRSPQWTAVAEILRESADNPYANTIAAKLLIADGQCREARTYAFTGLSRGQTLPSLELSMMVDALGCPNANQYREAWSKRIAHLIQANPDPHPLLETYLLLGAIAMDQSDLISAGLKSPFAAQAKSPLDDLNDALQRAASGRAQPRDIGFIEKALPTVIFSENTQRLIVGKIREGNGQGQASRLENT